MSAALKGPKSKKIRMILAVHVDDMIVAGSKKDCDWLRSVLSEVFPVNDLGELTWYTGCSFKRDVKKCTLSIVQTAFIDKIVERFHVFSTSPSPAAANCRLEEKGETRNKETGHIEKRWTLCCGCA